MIELALSAFPPLTKTFTKNEFVELIGNTTVCPTPATSDFAYVAPDVGLSNKLLTLETCEALHLKYALQYWSPSDESYLIINEEYPFKEIAFDDCTKATCPQSCAYNVIYWEVFEKAVFAPYLTSDHPADMSKHSSPSLYKYFVSGTLVPPPLDF